MHRIIPLTFSLLLLSAASAAMYWEDVVQTVEIHSDGRVTVSDERSLQATGDDDFGEAFICLDHEAHQAVTLLDSSGAVDAPGAASAFSQACEDGSGGTELVVKYDSRRRHGRVRFDYELENTLDVRSDVVDWYWGIYGTRNIEARGYRLRVNAPGGMEFPYDAVVYRFDNPEHPEVELSPDRSRLDVSLRSIPESYGVEIRWLMDPDLFDEKGSEPGLEEKLREMTDLENILVVGAPEFRDLDYARELDRGTDEVTVSGTVLPGASGARVRAVRAAVGSAIADPCEQDPGSDAFTCTVWGLGSGDNRVTVQAEGADERITSTTFTVRRRTFMDALTRSPWLLLTGAGLFAIVRGSGISQRRKFSDVASDGMMYPFEPPNDLPPAAVQSLLKKPGVPAGQDAFAATVMDLARRGWGEFAGKGRRFAMYVDMEREEEGLLSFEKYTLRFLRLAAKRTRPERTNEQGWRLLDNAGLKRVG